jgi:hypothetical protein
MFLKEIKETQPGVKHLVLSVNLIGIRKLNLIKNVIKSDMFEFVTHYNLNSCFNLYLKMLLVFGLVLINFGLVLG